MIINKVINKIKQMMFYKKLRWSGVVSIGCNVNIDTKSKFDSFVNIAHHAEIINSKIGKRTSIGRYTKIRDSIIGSYCSISWDCSIGAVSHPMQCVTSHAFTFIKKFGIVKENCDTRPLMVTYIGNDVWIGCDVTIIAGVRVGDGAVIGAGAIVTKDVEPYTIVAGCPAKEIRKRFGEDIIKDLLEIKWWHFSDETLQNNIELFKKPISEDIIKRMKQLKNLNIKK